MSIFKSHRTPAVEKKSPAIDLPGVELPPVAPAVLVESPPQSAPSQLDRIEAMLTKVTKRLQC